MGTGNGQFNAPEGVAVDGSGNVFVVDSFNNRIQKFTNPGTFLTAWGSHARGGQALGSGLARDERGEHRAAALAEDVGQDTGDLEVGVFR